MLRAFSFKARFPLLITPGLICSTNVRFIDGSWHMPNSGRDGRSEFQEQHIPSSQHWDIDEICDHESDLPHMVAPVDKMIRILKKFGITPDQNIVVYDNCAHLSSPIVWYTLNAFGFDNVSILNGGLSAWKDAGLSVDSGTSPVPPSISLNNVEFRSWMFRDKSQVLENLDTKEAQIIDARSSGRFYGLDPEPREGLRSGHIPGSFNVPWNSLTTKTAGGYVVFKDEEGIHSEFTKAGVDISPGRKIIVSCGSGVTAAVLALGLRILDKPAEDISLYDGSWSEWGLPDSKTPVTTRT